MPKQLCTDCRMKLDACHEFAEVCVQAEEKLRLLTERKNFKVLKRGTKEATGLVVSPNSNCEDSMKSFSTDPEPKTSKVPNSLKLVGSDYCCPLCVEGSMTQDVDSDPDVQYDGT